MTVIHVSRARVARLAAAAALAAGLFGCASRQLAEPVATPATVQGLRAANLAPAHLGTFALAPGKDPSMDKSIGVRASTLSARTGSFSQDLRDRVAAELKASGLYDEAADAVIEGRLTDSEVSTGMSEGSGRLGAHFTVTRAGRKAYDKDVLVESKWESSFIGGVAIPAAMREYEALYPALVSKLFADPDFRAALAR